MHVLLASHRYYPVPGGTERAVQTLAEGLVRRGWRATVVTQIEPGVPASEVLNGVQVIRIPVRPFAGIRFPSGYLRTLRGIDADLFHLHGNRIWCADFYFPRAGSFSWPQVLTGYGFYQWEMHPGWFDRWYFQRYFPGRVRRFDAYTTSTERERGQLLRWGVRPEMLVPVALGVPLDEFTAPASDPAVLREGWKLERPLVAVYAGGFFENKRVDRLVEAIAPVRDRWALVAIGRDQPGSPHDLAECRSLAERAGVEFRAPGVLDRRDVIRALYTADAVVLGSEYEGFGLLPVEAMAAGRPFVAYESGAVPEMAATGAGTVVRTAAEFAAALSRLEDRAERERRGAIGRSTASFYSAEAMVDRFVAVYRRVLGEPATVA
ncbi:MAG TPA: glycosyltransferase family 4 protein [Thermoplasmata archaeon]|nr:glycosyltransferase family 4 protein [Thermoplasmata archaeon]